MCVCVCACVHMHVQSQSCLTFDMDCNPPGSSVHGMLQARILEWVAISFSRRSSWPRNQTQVSSIVGRFFTSWATREALIFKHMPENLSFSWWELDRFLGIIYSLCRWWGNWSQKCEGICPQSHGHWMAVGPGSTLPITQTVDSQSHKEGQNCWVTTE